MASGDGHGRRRAARRASGQAAARRGGGHETAKGHERERPTSRGARHGRMRGSAGRPAALELLDKEKPRVYLYKYFFYCLQIPAEEHQPCRSEVERQEQRSYIAKCSQ